MADRRMFAKSIVTSDAFLDLPATARCLYFGIGMEADDDGFVNNVNSIMRSVGATKEDVKILVAKKFLILFDSGVVLVKHWKINNYIQKDRYHPTKYRAEKEQIEVKENGAYRKKDGVYTEYLDTENRLGKDSIDKPITSIYPVRSNEALPKEEPCNGSSSKGGVYTEDMYTRQLEEFMKKVRDAWNQTGGRPVREFKLDSRRGENMIQRIEEVGLDVLLETIAKVKSIPFFLGENKRRWTITLDWFLDPDNFQKILEGQFDERFVSDDDMGGTDGTGGAKAGGGGGWRRPFGDEPTEAEVRARRREEAKRMFPGLKTALSE